MPYLFSFKWRSEYNILILCWLGWINIYLCRSVLPPILPLLAKEFNMTHAESGMLETLYLLGYLLVKVPIGLLSNRFGVRKTLTMGIVGYAFSTFLNFFATNTLQLYFLRFLLGFFQGIHLPVANMLLSEKFGKSQRKAIGFHESGPNIGNSIALPLTIAVVSIWNWRIAFLLFSLPAFILAVFTYLMLEEDVYTDSVEKSFRGILNLKSYANILLPLIVAHSTYNLCLRTLFIFIPSYLIELKGFNYWFAGWISTLIPLAGIFAKISSGYLAEMAGRRNAICITIAISSFMILLLTVEIGLKLTYLVFILIGLSIYTYSPIIYSSATETLPRELKSIGLGLITMVGNMVGAFSIYLVGFTIDVEGYIFALRSIALLAFSSSIFIYLNFQN